MDSSSSDAALRARIRQQEVVAELGQQALETDDLDGLMRDAVAAVAETLDNEYAKVLELLPDGNELVLRHGVGWRDGVVGGATVPTDRDSQAGYTLAAEAPVIVDDLAAEPRFSGPDLLTDHDVVSGISVVIGSTDDPWGVLGTHTTDRREFTDDDANFVQSVANVLASAVENHRVQRRREEVYGRISDAFFALDDDWRFTYLNDRARELIAPEGESLVGTEVWEQFPAAVGRKFESKYEAAMYRQETVSFEEYYPEPLNAWFEVRAYPSGTGLSVYFRDVTDRKERERELRRTERRFTAIFEDPNILVGLLGTDGTVLDINQTAMEYIDADLDDVTGEPFWETPWWGDDADVRADVREWVERAADGEYVDFETPIGQPDERRYVNGVFRPVTNDDGDVVSVIVSDRDVTERRQYERRLEESERRYRALAEYFPNGLVTLFDEDLNYTLAAGQAFDSIPVDPADAEGEHVRDVWDEATADALVPAFEAALDGAEESVELAYEGREWVVHVVPITDEHGDVFAGMTMAQDITEQVERQQRLETLVEQLEESNERLEQFAYAASHDLQEPLRMVSSYLQLVERRYADELDEDGREFIEFAVDGADRMRDMIDGLLEYSRVDSRGDPFEQVDLNDPLEDARANLEVKISEADADVTAESLPTVTADPGQLRQLFQNLLDNAVTYSGEGPPSVHVAAERDGDDWVVSVSDDGVGIDAADTDSVFEVFERLHGPDEHGGTGIGLALCERIVERHGGDIWVDSTPGDGSTFRFTLPAEGDR
ncbi:PAS domain-containing protein [Halobaculum sp. P14]|uniref:PAS domain-containing protein n=1 Tax=Halobaculum sp. P14 TaxID=3421638 RepID=UPI003EB9A11E